MTLFQAVEAPAPLVAGREVVLRAAFTGDAELEVDIVSGGTTRTFSGDGELVEIPADAVTTDATFVVRLSDGSARHPESGEAPLDAQETGPLDVRLVPFEVDGFVPDTSAPIVEGYRAALMATFPVTDVRITVGEVVHWDGALDLGDINVRLGELQEAAMIAGDVGWDVYFYGMVTGVATRDELDGITGTSEAGGDSPTRAYFATGAAFGDQKAEDTLIHELGHTHRLLHTPCDGEDDPDPDYPHAGGVIGVEGYDRRTGTFVSPDTSDLMSYCFPRWVSDYSWTKMADHVAAAQDFSGLE